MTCPRMQRDERPAFQAGPSGCEPRRGCPHPVPRKHRKRCAGFVNRGAGRKSLARLLPVRTIIFRHLRGSNRPGGRLLSGIMRVQILPEVPMQNASHAEAVEAAGCNPALTRCESGGMLHSNGRSTGQACRGRLESGSTPMGLGSMPSIFRHAKMPPKHRQRCSRFVTGRAGRKSPGRLRQQKTR